MYLNNEVSRVYTPAFNELFVVHIWPTDKDNIYIKQYLPDYNENQKYESNYLLNIMNSKYPGSVLSLIKKALISRKSKEIENNEDLIEITPKSNLRLMRLLHIRVKSIVLTSIATPRRAISLLKIKSKGKRTINDFKKYEANLSVCN